MSLRLFNPRTSESPFSAIGVFFAWCESMSILARRIETEFGYWIFPSMKKPGKHIPRVNGLHDKVLAKGAAAGKPLHFVLYDLRHTWATAQAGIDLATLAQILGHSGLRVAMKY